MGTGYECYEVQPGMAKCMKECVPGKDGTCLHHAPPMKPSKKSDISYSANTLFCWSFYTADTGSTKKSYELDLLRTQLFLGASIFGCEAYRVYSDVETWLAPEKVSTITSTTLTVTSTLQRGRRPEHGSTQTSSSQPGKRSKRKAHGRARIGL